VGIKSVGKLETKISDLLMSDLEIFVSFAPLRSLSAKSASGRRTQPEILG